MYKSQNIRVTKRKHHIILTTVTSLRFLTFTFWNYYVLKLLRLETIKFSDATLSDINIVLCYVLSKYRVYRVPGFLSSRPNWVPSTISPANEGCSLLWGPTGRHTCMRGRGWGTQIRWRDWDPRAGIFKKSMGVRNRGGIGLSYSGPPDYWRNLFLEINSGAP